MLELRPLLLLAVEGGAVLVFQVRLGIVVVHKATHEMPRVEVVGVLLLVVVVSLLLMV